MATSLIRGRQIVTGVVEGGRADIVHDGAILQRDGVIAEIGSYPDLAARNRPDEVVGGSRSIVLPGLVNAHHHLGVTPFQLGVPDLPLEEWIVSRLGTPAVDPYLDTLYSAFEMIASGVTTVQHLHGRMWQGQELWSDTTDRILRAYRDVGMRVSYSAGVIDQNRLVLDEDAFLATVPAELGDAVRAIPGNHRVPLEEQLKGSFSDVRRRWGSAGDGLVKVQLAPQNLHWCSDRALLAVGECAISNAVGMHMHLVETPYQEVYARRRTGGTAVAHLGELGLLGPQLTLGHGVWLSEADIDRVAETRTFICHNASSNLRLKSGVAPLNSMLASGVRVALGIDEAGINDDRDMLQEMRVVLNLHRSPGIGTPSPSATEVFQMATEHGALTTGFGDRIGTLAPGKAADLVLLDWDSIAKPFLAPDVPVVDAVVQRGKVAGVQAVVVAGQVVYRDGRFTKVDRDAMLAELARDLDRPLTADEVQRSKLAKALVPRVRRFFSGWLG